MKLLLEVKKGPRADIGRSFTIERTEPDNITVGRSARKTDILGEDYPHIQISSDDLRLSRWHFMLQLRPPNCFVADIGSANHTFINDFSNSLKDTIELKDGDVIRVGRTFLKVTLIPEEVKDSVKYNCIKCGKELKELEVKSSEKIEAVDFTCHACKEAEKIKQETEKQKKAFSEEKLTGQELRGSKESVKGIVQCFNCRKDLPKQANKDRQAEGVIPGAIYLCEDCAMKERVRNDQVGNYMILKQIGIGGMGVVYKAWHNPTGRLVAIKELLPDKLMNDKSLKIFHREISITRELVHPNIVRFYDSFTKNRKPYLLTEFLPGGNAEEKILNRKKPFSVKEACHIILDVLEGLSYAHEKGIVHRDISPNNILFDNNGIGKLSDMGLAKSFELAGQSGITSPGEIGGKYLYIAPEQILDYRYVKPRADVFSVGACLYYFITGKYHYHFSSPLDMVLARVGVKEIRNPFRIVLEDEPIPVLKRKPDVPRSLAIIIDRCLKKKPEERFQSGVELKEAITKMRDRVP